jgi:hypothetical protein
MTGRPLSRRGFLGGMAGLGASSILGLRFDRPAFADEQKPLPRVAGINSIYRWKSHAYHIEGRFIDGYSREGVHHQPPFKLARMYNDQYPASDLSRDVCKKHGIELCKTAAETLGPAGKLDVDAVLLVIEHGDYPANEFGQILYPRFELFQQIVDVFRSASRGVPVFVDKHLSYDHQKAAQMVASARELNFPLMAGSSLPVTWRRPEIEPPLGTQFREGLSIFGFEHDRQEIYLFHALEVLQCMLERRRGGETGVRKVTCIDGPAVWKAGDDGLWSWKLLHAALARSPSCNVGDVKENVTHPTALLIDYVDGTRGAVLNLLEHVSDLSFAGRIDGQDEPIAANFYLPAPPGAKFFDPLTWNIEKFFSTGKPPYPVERTLLTSTMLDLGLRSLKRQQSIESPALAVKYDPPADSGFVRGRYTDK